MGRFWLLEHVKKRFDKEGVEIPFPYRTVVYKNDLPPAKQEDPAQLGLGPEAAPADESPNALMVVPQPEPPQEAGNQAKPSFRNLWGLFNKNSMESAPEGQTEPGNNKERVN